MPFEEIVDQAIEMVRRRGQVSYRMLKRQFELDDASFEDLKDEILYSQSQIVDGAGQGFVWTGDPERAVSSPTSVVAPVPVTGHKPSPISYTPQYLTEKILAGLLGNDSSLEPLKALLIERTEGNPFFLEESVRTLVETQVLTGEPGAYRLAQELPSIQVPATMQAILAARIDRLSREEKRLLQTAAVIGTEVPYTLLQAIADMPEEALYRGLAHLQGAEFLYETSLFPERVYTFKHALTQEVAYGSLLQERRRVLHARIVEALEALGDDRLADQVERLAYHAFRGEVWEKALTYSRQAGEKAMTQSAYREMEMTFWLPETEAALANVEGKA